MHATYPPPAAAVSTPPPQEVIMHMLIGMWSAQAVATAARLGIADALANSQPQDSTALAHAVGADAGALARLFRTLVSLGLLAQPHWQDTEAVRILRSCRTSITPDGKLLVIEIVIPDDNHPSPAQLIDLNMLAMPGGQERTASEYGALLAQAGFRLTRSIPTGSPYHVLEAVVV